VTSHVSDWFRIDDRLFGGSYPGEIPPGVDFVVDLTEKDELPAYPRDNLEHRRLPIPDFGVPSAPEMRRILDTIDEALAAGHTVYVHCRGGVGRTGTVAGCYLRRHGLPSVGRLPETDEQRGFIRAWRPGT
jgi:protein-tyrosine phosphatase